MTLHTRDPLRFRVALVQMQSGRQPAKNIATAIELISEAKQREAHYVLTPEMTNIMETDRDALFAAISPEETDAGLASLRELARSLKLWVHIGSFAIKVSAERAANRSFLIDPEGEIVARYDKIHMFDVDLADGESYRESRNYRPGELAVLADLPWGLLGLTVCYDLRFPELYRAMKDVDIIVVPSAFTETTGRAHWESLVRARAIENLAYVLAPAQGGYHLSGRETHGDSMIVDPWGTVLDRLPRGSGVVVASINPAYQANLRKSLPALTHRVIHKI